jgi:predicted metal-dependent hydrolase
MAKPEAGTVVQGGRAKAYRPIPAAAREEAFQVALLAYERGDFFLAHELLEPAWMGTDDVPERELYQGLIKLAAAFVHGVRGNPRGIAKNLEGARPRLAAAHAAGMSGGLDLPDLLREIDTLIARLAKPPDAVDTSRFQSPRLRRMTP